MQSTVVSFGLLHVHDLGEPPHVPNPLHSRPETLAMGHRGKAVAHTGPENPGSHTHEHVMLPDEVEIEYVPCPLHTRLSHPVGQSFVDVHTRKYELQLKGDHAWMVGFASVAVQLHCCPRAKQFCPGTFVSL